MPESSVLTELVGRPHQSAPIEEAGADNYPGGAAPPSEDEGAYRDNYCTDDRIDEEYFLLMRPKIIGLGKDDDICQHVKQQDPERKRVK